MKWCASAIISSRTDVNIVTEGGTNAFHGQVTSLFHSVETKGFASINKVAPGTHTSTNNGRFQFDSASGSNNSIVVEGLDVTNLL